MQDPFKVKNRAEPALPDNIWPEIIINDVHMTIKRLKTKQLDQIWFTDLLYKTYDSGVLPKDLTSADPHTTVKKAKPIIARTIKSSV